MTPAPPPPDLSELKEKAMLELLESGWGVIANAGGGDWTRESKDWQEAAVRWRERYHSLLKEHPALAALLSDTEASPR